MQHNVPSSREDAAAFAIELLPLARGGSGRASTDAGSECPVAAAVRTRLARIAPHERSGFLADLAIRVEDPGPILRVARDESAEHAVLAARLACLATDLPRGERTELARVLGAAGLIGPDRCHPGADAGAAAEPADAPASRASPHLETLRAAVGLPPDDPALPGPAEAAYLAVLLIEPVLLLESLVWRAWREMSPDSPIKQGPPLKDLIAGAARAGGEGDPGHTDAVARLEHEVRRFRRVAAALIASVSRAGEIAHQTVDAVSPARVERFARAEKKWNESAEVAAWRKYQQLAGKLDPATVEASVVRGMIEYAETLVGPEPPAPPTRPAG